MKICLDLGHGGKDSGAKGKYLLEKTINLLAGNNLAFWLCKYGHDVKMTRHGDEDVSLHDRVKLANDWKAELFISLHCNANENPKYNGIEVYSFPGAEASKTWALRFQNALVSAFPDRNDRKAKEANFQVLRDTKMSAVLIEMGFVTNRKEEKWLDHHYTAIAHVIADELGNIKKVGEG